MRLSMGFLALLLPYLLCDKLVAQESNAALDEVQATENAPSPLNLDATLRESSNLIAPNSTGHQSQTQLDIKAGMKLSDWGKFSIAQGISKSHQEEETLDLSNTKTSVFHNRIPLHRDVGVQNGISIGLPTNRKTREKDKLLGSLSIGNLLDIRLGQGPIVIDNRILINKNFHQYTVNSNGTPTIEWSLTEGVTLTGELTEKLSLSTDFSYISSRTYHGTTKNRLDISEELSIQITKQLSAAIGHSNGDELISSTERSSSIEAFDAETSTIYGEIHVSF